MSKTIYVEVRIAGKHELAPADVNGYLYFEGYKVTLKYIADFGFSSPNDALDYYERSLVGASSISPANVFEKITYEREAPNGGTITQTTQKYQLVYVNDDFEIPWQYDLTGLTGGIRFSSSAKTGITSGPLSFQLASGSFGSMSFSGFLSSLVSSTPAVLENVFKLNGLSGLGTAVRNSNAAIQAITAIQRDGLTLLQSEMQAISDPGADFARLDAAVDAYLARSATRVDRAFDQAVLVPGNPNADAAAHTLIRSLGIVGASGVPVNGTATLQVDVTVPGVGTLTTSASASVGYVVGGSGDYTIRGQSGRNVLVGGDGANTLYAGAGRDYLHGGAGNDVLVIGGGSAFMDGGSGTDTVRGAGTAAGTAVSVDGRGQIHLRTGAQDVTATDVERLAFVDAATGTARIGIVSDAYQSLLGRSANVAELGVWDSALAGGASIAAMTGAIAGAAGRAAVGRYVAGSYLAVMDRPANAGEVQLWTDALVEGQITATDFAATLAGAASTSGALAALVSDAYRLFLGRVPDADETLYWTGALVGGATDRAGLDAVLAAEAGAAGAVRQLYQTYMGRAANAAETTYWAGAIESGAVRVDQMRGALVADAAGRSHAASYIDTQYKAYFGRSAGTGEIAYWQDAIALGYSNAQFESVLARDPGAQAYAATRIADLYVRLMGRQPGDAERSYWQGALASGTSYAAMASVLERDGGSLASKAGVTGDLYRTLFGRDPSAAEIAVWQRTLVTAADPQPLRDALVVAPEGIAYLGDRIDAAYLRFMGRYASVAEQTVWLRAIRAGSDVDAVADAVAASPAAAAVTATLIGNSYYHYLQRTATEGEARYWAGALASGTDFADFIHALEAAGGSNELTLGRPERRTLAEAGDVNTFSVTLLGGVRYTVATVTGAVNDPLALDGHGVTIAGPNGRILAQGNSADTRSAVFGYTPAETGTYRVTVDGTGQASGDYTLSVGETTSRGVISLGRISDPGGTVATAYDLGFLRAGGGMGLLQQLSAADRDVFRFRIDQATQMEVQIPTGSVLPSISDKNGVFFLGATLPGGTAHNLFELPAGEYYLTMQTGVTQTFDYNFMLFY